MNKVQVDIGKIELSELGQILNQISINEHKIEELKQKLKGYYKQLEEAKKHIIDFNATFKKVIKRSPYDPNLQQELAEQVTALSNLQLMQDKLYNKILSTDQNNIRTFLQWFLNWNMNDKILKELNRIKYKIENSKLRIKYNSHMHQQNQLFIKDFHEQANKLKHNQYIIQTKKEKLQQLKQNNENLDKKLQKTIIDCQIVQNEIELYHYITNINYRVVFERGTIFNFINNDGPAYSPQDVFFHQRVQ